MARIAGINIPNHQHAEIALTAIFGIGRARAQAICVAAGVQGTRKIKDLTDGELEKIRENVARFTVEGDLRREVSMRSEEHTSELQSPDHLVCRLLLEKKKKNQKLYYSRPAPYIIQ